MTGKFFCCTVPLFFKSLAYMRESVNRLEMDMICKRRDIWNWKKHLFLNISSTNIDTLVPLLYQSIETRSIEVSRLLSQPLPFLRLYHRQNICHRGGFWQTKKADVQEVPTVVLEFSPELLGLYGVWHCHDEAVPPCQLAWMFASNCISKLWQNFTVCCKIHIFIVLLKMG
jgi:hypothetical protein